MDNLDLDRLVVILKNKLKNDTHVLNDILNINSTIPNKN